MDIDRCVVGYLQTNCYILSKGNEVLIIDPGDEADKIISKVGNKKVVGILITHSHPDHIGALDDLLSNYKVDKYDQNNLKEGSNKIGSFVFDVIYTPGHLDDEVVYYFKDKEVMFVGDFIFKDSIGRMDLEGGSTLDMKKSIDSIIKYPSTTIIYPGHGDKTSLINELDNLKYYSSIL